MATELIFTGEADYRRVPLTSGKTYLLGRSRSCDIVVKGPKISRRHTTLCYSGGQLHVCDAGSRNGTHFRGQSVGRRGAKLRNGDSFRIGGFTLALRSLDTSLDHSLNAARLPGYELLAPIGRGAYSSVFSAIQASTGRLVAVKKLHATEDEDELIRFEREARLMAQLNSPHVVQVVDFVVVNNHPHIAMEYIDGQTIAQKTRGLGLPLVDVVLISRGLTEGLARLHEAGVIHRDLKPANVLLPFSGGVKLTDLGIAKELGEAGPTSEGQGLGTFGYMPPEQALNARDVDSRSDLYGLGATIYHLLTGRPPFRFRRIVSQATLMEAIEVLRTRLPVPPSVHRPETPPWLEGLVMKLLAKTPVERGETSEVLDTLRRWAEAYTEDAADLDETWTTPQ